MTRDCYSRAHAIEGWHGHVCNTEHGSVLVVPDIGNRLILNTLVARSIEMQRSNSMEVACISQDGAYTSPC